MPRWITWTGIPEGGPSLVSARNADLLSALVGMYTINEKMWFVPYFVLFRFSLSFISLKQIRRAMKYFFYVDESGPFDEKLSRGKASFVGGICSEVDSTGWNTFHKNTLSELNRHSRYHFSYPQHYHCGPLLGRAIPGSSNVSIKDLEEFAKSVYSSILSNSLFAFGSRNRGKRFEYSPQATYVMNLVAALRCGFQKLAEVNRNDVQRVCIVIAQRSIGETTAHQGKEKYMSLLLGYVRDQLLIGEAPGVDLARRLERNSGTELRSGLGDREGGLIAADFVCCFLRMNAKPPASAPIYVCSPDTGMLVGDYRLFHERQAQELLMRGYYASGLDFMIRYFPGKTGVPDVHKVLDEVERQKDREILEREIPALLAVVHQLAKHRTERV